jgi:putative oxidoreductase
MWGITALRIVTGVVFLMHGQQKLFTAGLWGTAAQFSKMHIPLPSVAGPVVTLMEFLGGICLILGVFTRWAAILLALDMAGAILFVHGRNGFFLPRGFEYAMVMLVVCVALAMLGPGPAALGRKVRM